MKQCRTLIWNLVRVYWQNTRRFKLLGRTFIASYRKATPVGNCMPQQPLSFHSFLNCICCYNRPQPLNFLVCRRSWIILNYSEWGPYFPFRWDFLLSIYLSEFGPQHATFARTRAFWGFKSLTRPTHHSMFNWHYPNSSGSRLLIAIVVTVEVLACFIVNGVLRRCC